MPSDGQAVADFEAVARSRRWNIPSRAAGQCSIAAHEFAETVEGAEMLACRHSRFGLPEHAVTRLPGGLIVDWTYRQFEPDAAFPHFHDWSVLTVLWDDVEPLPTDIATIVSQPKRRPSTRPAAEVAPA